MKNRKRETRKGGAPHAAAAHLAPAGHPYWHYIALGVLAASLVVLWAYWPSMSGPFLFDDNFLPFAVSNISAQPLSAFLHGQRPLLMATYWISARLSARRHLWYHFLNVIIHCVTTGLVFFIVRRFARVGQRAASRGADLLAGFAAALFLLHPVQTEAVAYVAGRSDALSVMLAFSAFAVFLYRPESAAVWKTALAVLLLFGAALAAKEHTIALPALLLLTDYWWSNGSRLGRHSAQLEALRTHGARFRGRGGIILETDHARQHRRIRAQGIHLVSVFLHPMARHFRLPGHVPAARANLTLDWDFPISHTILEHGAIVWLVALLALAAAAWHAAPPLSAGGLWFPGFSDAAGAHVVHSADPRPGGRAAPLLRHAGAAADRGGRAGTRQSGSPGVGGGADWRWCCWPPL